MRANPTPIPPVESGVYAIRHLPTNRIYVGSSRTIRLRWKAHLVLLRRGTHYLAGLQEAWRDGGATAFTFEVIEAVPDGVDIREREQYWLTALNVTNPTLGFNLSSTAIGSGAPHTEAWKRRQSEYARTVTAPMLRSVTEEQAIAIAHAVAAGESDASVARRFGVANYTVSRIATGFVYKHLDMPRRTKGTSPFRNNRTFTDSQVAEIRRRKAAGERTRDLMVEFGVCQPTIDRIVRGSMYADHAATAAPT